MLDHSKSGTFGKIARCTLPRTTSTFDGIVHQKFYVASVRNAHAKDKDEEYCLKRDDIGKPIYGPNRAKYLSCDDPMDRTLSLQEALNPFKNICVWKKAIDFLGALPLLPKQIYSPCIVDWNVLNTLGCAKAFEEMLEIKFDEVVTDEELITKKLIKFRLGGRRHSLTLLEFALRLGLYHSAEIREEGFEVSATQTIGSPLLKTPERFVTRIAKKMSLLTDEVLNVMSAPIYYMCLYATTLRELIGSNGRLIAEDPTYGVPRVAIPRPPRPTMQDLYDRMGHMETRQGTLERMSRRQSYHSDMYAGVFEFMARHYGVPLDGAYAPPGYDEEQQQQE
ncbi:hypothetical protein Tco_0267186 [Tanacetum coccineum]